jgi:hypothetical protein
MSEASCTAWVARFENAHKTACGELLYGGTAAATGYGAKGASVRIRRKARADWLALEPGAHDGYVSWERFEAIRTMVSSNVPTSRHHGAPMQT